MIYLVVIILLSVVFAVDPDLYLPYLHTKSLLFIILPSLILSGKFLYEFIRFRKSTLVFSFIEYILIAQIVWAIIGNHELLTQDSNTDLLQMLSFFLFTFLARQIMWKEKMNAENQERQYRSVVIIIRSLWIVGLCQAVLGIGQYYSFPDFVPIGTIKTPMIGTIGHANSYGSFLAIAIMALVVDLQNSTSVKSKIIRWISGSITFTALILNGSRGAILALSCSIAVYLIFLYREKESQSEEAADTIKVHVKKFRLAVIMIVFMVSMGCLLYFLYHVNVESSKGRLFVWQVAAPMIADHPVLGVGVGRFSIEYLNYQSRFFANDGNKSLAYKAANMKQAHNEYFQAFCESGIIGGILFLSLWIFVLWPLFFQTKSSSYDDKVNKYGLGAIIMVILMHSLVDTPLHIVPISVVAYCLIGMSPIPVSFIHTIQLKSGKVFLSIIIILFLYSAFIISLTLNQYQGYAHWQKGYEYAKEKRWSPAILEYQAALEKLPQKGELLFHTGAALALNGSYSSGVFSLQESKKWYNDRNIYLSLSYAYLHLGEFREAEIQAKRALSMFPDQLAPDLLLGQIFYKQGRFDESKKSFLKCIWRKTSFHSDDVNQISQDAEGFWNNYYHESIPSHDE